MTTRRTFLANGRRRRDAHRHRSVARARRQRARHHRDRDQDRPNHALQRPGLGLWRDRQTEAAYFKMINEQGGVNGRKINLISLDDGYSPPKTVEQARRLVEQEGVAFFFNTLGTASNAAIRQYLNDDKIPQLFVATGASLFADPEHFKWTIGFNPSYQTGVAHLRQAYSGHQAQRQGRAALSERRFWQGISDRPQRRPRRARGHGDQRGVVRDLGAERRLAGGDPAGQRRRRVRYRCDAQIRGAGDPQVLRSRLGRRRATSATSDSRSPRCSNPRGSRNPRA